MIMPKFGLERHSVHLYHRGRPRLGMFVSISLWTYSSLLRGIAISRLFRLICLLQKQSSRRPPTLKACQIDHNRHHTERLLCDQALVSYSIPARVVEKDHFSDLAPSYSTITDEVELPSAHWFQGSL